MSLLRRSGAQVALLTLAVIGMAIAIYLTIVHYNESVTLVCSESGFVNCTRVITSRYAYVPGTDLPISLPGLGWNLVMAGLALFGILRGDQRRWLRVSQFIWALLGMLTVLYLIYVEIILLHNLCAWCTALHVLILLMFLIAIARLPGTANPDDDELDFEDEAEVSPKEIKRVKE